MCIGDKMSEIEFHYVINQKKKKKENSNIIREYSSIGRCRRKKQGRYHLDISANLNFQNKKINFIFLMNTII